ncbi:MAG: hypothetical protein N2Z67_10615 [Acetobacteraceae bacterium]|nr:hypothetical protein [Acetobacteraceae bacterium]
MPGEALALRPPSDAAPGLIVREVRSPAEARAFLTLPRRLGGHRAGWTMPPLSRTRLAFDPRRNGALAEWEVARFLAWRGGVPVGRIGASLPKPAALPPDPLLPYTGGRPGAGWARAGAGGEGHFGFLALERDRAVLQALLSAAARWLRARGASRISGPFGFTINHEAGALVAGFGLPGSIETPENPAWLPRMIEDAGLLRAKDLLAFDLYPRPRPPRPLPDGLRIRRIGALSWPRRAPGILRLFNEAWRGNWGFREVGPAEARSIARLLRPLALSGAVFVAEWQGEAVGVAALLPNVNEATDRLDGALPPWAWPRLAAAVLGRVGSARMPLLGTVPAVRGRPVGNAAVDGLLDAANALAVRRGWRRIEVSWVLEDNAPMIARMKREGAVETRRWRVWEAAL